MLGIATSTTHVTAPIFNTKLPFDPLNDFAPVAIVGMSPYVLVVNPKLPVKTVADVVALAKAPEIGFDTFIISANTPFSPDDCEELIVDAPSVVARYFPYYRELYARAGWTMFQSIDRVYDASKAFRRLGFRCRTGFKEKLDELEKQLEGK